jgi:putative nucleotidyltransferase with HDIG domain
LEQQQVRMINLLAAFSRALDLAMGQPLEYNVRCAYAGLRIADLLGLAPRQRQEVLYASFLKDAGCPSVRAQVTRELGVDDIGITRAELTLPLLHGIQPADLPSKFAEACAVDFRARGITDEKLFTVLVEAASQRTEHGAQITAQMGFARGVQDIVNYIFESWDGSGLRNLRGSFIPIGARILGMMELLDAFASTAGPAAALEVAEREAGKRFDPEVVKAYLAVAGEEGFWQTLHSPDLREQVMALEPGEMVKYVDDEHLEGIASAFAQIVDSKSPYTARHSEDVALIAETVARNLGLPDQDAYKIRIAALLHDLGKLSVPNTILDKPDKPSPEEWQVIQQHPFYTHKVLEPLPALIEIEELASEHHERLDGKGYFRQLTGEHLPLGAQIIAAADVYQALSVDRPYRQRLEPGQILDIMAQMQGSHLNPDCVGALRSIL